MLTCEHCQNLLLDRSYGLLPDAESMALDSHIRECPACAQAMERIQQMRGLIGQAARSQFPEVHFHPPALSTLEVAVTRRQNSTRRFTWVFAASLLVAAFAGIGGPTLVDFIGFRTNKNAVDRQLAQVKSSDDERINQFQKYRTNIEDAKKRSADAEKKNEDLLEEMIKVGHELETKRARPFQVSVTGPRTAIPGAPNEYHIAITDNQGRPSTAKIDVSIKTDGGKELYTKHFDPQMQPDGNVLRLPAGLWSQVPAGAEVNLHLTATDSKTNTKSDVVESLRLLEPVYTTFLATDKPMYRPGEPVWFRSLTLDRIRFLPPQRDMNLRFEILAPSGQVMDGSQIMGVSKPHRMSAEGQMLPIAGPDGHPVRGVGTGMYALPQEIPGGEYILNVWEVPQQGENKESARKPLAVRKFIVNNYTPDKFTKELEFDGASYGPGDVVQAKFTAKDQSKPLANVPITVAVDVDGQVVKLDVAPTKTDSEGNASIKFTLPKNNAMKNASVNVTITANSITETLPKRVKLATKSLNVEFFPEGGELIAGTPNRIYFRVTDPFGKPDDLTGQLSDGTKDICTVQTLTSNEKAGVKQGLGMFEFTPEKGKSYSVKIQKPITVVPPSGGYKLPVTKDAGLAMSVPTGVSKLGEPITVKLTSTTDRNVYVGAYIRGQAVGHTKVKLEANTTTDAKLELANVKIGGVTRITVFDLPSEEALGREDLKPLAERLVFRQPGETLKLQYTARKATQKEPKPGTAFTPGDRIALDITSKDEADGAKPAILWTAVVHETVINKADEKSARLMPTHFVLGGEIQRGDQMEYTDFMLTDHPLAKQTLDLVLGTQGWRRFAEQAPTQFRNTKPSEDADKLMLVSATPGPLPTGWYNEGRKLYDKYMKDYEEVSIKRDEAANAYQIALYDPKPVIAIREANKVYDTNLQTFEKQTEKLAAYDQSLAARRSYVQYLTYGLLGLAVALMVISRTMVRSGSVARGPLMAGSAGAMILAGFLMYAHATTNKGNDEWRAEAAKVKQPILVDTKEEPNKIDPAQGIDDQVTTLEALAKPGDAADKMTRDDVRKFLDHDRAMLKEAKDEKYKKAMGDALKFDGKPGEGGGRGTGKPAPTFAPIAPGGPIPPLAKMSPPLPGAFAPNQPMVAATGGGMRPGGFGGGPKGAAYGGPGFGGQNRMLQEAQNLRARKDLEQLANGRRDNRDKNQMNGIERMEKAKQAPGYFGAAKGEAAAPQPNGLGWMQQYQTHVQPLYVREYAHVSTQAGESAIREDFTETLLWQPVLVTPKDGKLTVEFSLAGDVAPYQVLIAGHTTDGRLGAITGTIEVRKPFSLDVKLPQEISSSDKLDVVISGLNTTDLIRNADVSVKTTGLSTNGLESFKFDIPANNGASKVVRMSPSMLDGNLAVTIKGTSGQSDDAVERKMKVVADGFPATGSKSEVLEKQVSTMLTLPELIVPGTLQFKVTVYPNTLSEVQSGLEGLLREPNGCFEQTSTTNYPNVLILDYLTETNQAKPDVSKRAKELLDRGYGRLTSFECQKPTSGKEGYEWFGGSAPPHEALTAYGLLQFTDMARVHPVDAEMLKRTKEYLLSRRNGKGGFDRNGRAIDTFGYAAADLTDAYIIWAITEAERKDAVQSDLNKEIAAVLLATKSGERAKDPYFLALVANAVINRGMNDEGKAILRTIATLQAKDGSVTGATGSITRSSGQALLIETTALSVLGWLKANDVGEFRPNLDTASKWIGSQRGGSGSFGSTQSTILALKALIEFARNSKRPAESGELRVYVGAEVVARKTFATENVGPIVLDIPNAEKLFANGKAEIRVETDAKQSYPCTVAYEVRTRKPNSSSSCPINITTALNKTEATEGELLKVNVKVENSVGIEQGMVTAIVGLPAGVKLPEDMKQLKTLTEQKLVSYWEIRGRELILYWRGMAPKQTVELTIDVVADHPGEFRGPASRAYLYYGAEHKTWINPLDVKVTRK